MPDAGTGLLIVTVAAPTDAVDGSRPSSPSWRESSTRSASSVAVNTFAAPASGKSSTATAAWTPDVFGALSGAASVIDAPQGGQATAAGWVGTGLDS
ncbi:hypothetical protein [Pseudonocardia nigra]|uniref:hypothetical protein n=1 Tax=Pseudonocardia nigra TaxID=1921578 RepID=UPI001C5DB10B|nr:hypothetical protein [Pseudonocardia nigra]